LDALLLLLLRASVALDAFSSSAPLSTASHARDTRPSATAPAPAFKPRAIAAPPASASGVNGSVNGGVVGGVVGGGVAGAVAGAVAGLAGGGASAGGGGVIAGIVAGVAAGVLGGFIGGIASGAIPLPHSFLSFPSTRSQPYSDPSPPHAPVASLPRRGTTAAALAASHGGIGAPPRPSPAALQLDAALTRSIALLIHTYGDRIAAGDGRRGGRGGLIPAGGEDEGALKAKLNAFLAGTM
jgi:hypothetical protein